MAYDLRRQKFRFLDEYKPSADDPRDLLAWLSSAVSVSADLEPSPEVVRRELGRQSLAWSIARAELGTL